MLYRHLSSIAAVLLWTILFCFPLTSFAVLTDEDFLRNNFEYFSLDKLDKEDLTLPEVQFAQAQTAELKAKKNDYVESRHLDLFQRAPAVTVGLAKALASQWLNLQKRFPADPLKQAFFRYQALQVWTEHEEFLNYYEHQSKKSSQKLRDEVRREKMAIRRANSDFALAKSKAAQDPNLQVQWLLKAFGNLDMKVLSSAFHINVKQHYSPADLRKAAEILEEAGKKLTLLPQPSHESLEASVWRWSRMFYDADEEIPELSLAATVLTHSAELWHRLGAVLQMDLKSFNSPEIHYAHTRQIETANLAYKSYQKAALDWETNPEATRQVPQLKQAAAYAANQEARGLLLLKDSDYEPRLKNAISRATKTAKEAARLYLELAKKDPSALLDSAWAFKKAGDFATLKQTRLEHYKKALEICKRLEKEYPFHKYQKKFNNFSLSDEKSPNLTEQIENSIKYLESLS